MKNRLNKQSITVSETEEFSQGGEKGGWWRVTFSRHCVVNTIKFVESLIPVLDIHTVLPLPGHSTPVVAHNLSTASNKLLVPICFKRTL